MVKNISILGSTGSIGTQALDVSRKLNLNISAITAYSNIDILEQQVREFKPSLAVVFCEDKAKEFKTKIAPICSGAKNKNRYDICDTNRQTPKPL